MRAWIGRRQVGLAMLTLVAVLCLALVAWRVTYLRGLAELERQIENRLTINLRSVESEIERFRYLPDILGKDERIAGLLRLPGPQTVDIANTFLKAVRAMSGVAEIFALDLDGMALAASNWNEPDSLVGNNYAFRPYFTDAIAEGTGRLYAVGITTGTPGYYLASRVEAGGETLGAVVVKVDLTPLIRTWTAAGEMAAIADREGVVFLSSDPLWTYHPLTPLTVDTLARLDRQRRYHGVDLATAMPLLSSAQAKERLAVLSGDGGRQLLGRRDVETEGWQLLSALPLEPVEREARLVGGLAALALLPIIGLGLVLAGHQAFPRPRTSLAGPVHLPEVLTQAMDRASAKARRAGVVVTAAWEPGLKPVAGDPRALERAFIGLLDNAIGSSAAAGSGSVRVIAHGHAGTRLRVDILASGSTVPNLAHPRRGRQLDMSRALIDALGGTLDVEPAIEGGAVMRVNLPLHQATGAEPEPVRT